MWAALAVVCAASKALTPKEMQAKMGLGINLGNTLELAQPHIPDSRMPKEEYFDAYKAAGFTNVRIPVRWGSQADTAAPYTVNESWLASVEQAVDWALSKGMVAIINTHHETWLDKKPKFAEELPRLVAIWQQVAKHFAGKDETLLFEIFNEPHYMTTDDLNEMFKECLKAIRETNPTRIVMINGLKFGNPNWILQNPSALVVPKDSQLMLEIHNYDPFTYAGANPTVHSWGSDADRKALSTWVDGIQAYAEKVGLPIYYGEFGCTTEQTEKTGQLEWFKAHAAAIKANGWGASVWDDGHKHLLLDRATMKWDTGILTALGKHAPEAVLV